MSARPIGVAPAPTFCVASAEPLPCSMLRSIPAFSYQPIFFA